MVELKICGDSAGEVLAELRTLVNRVVQDGENKAAAPAHQAAAPAAWPTPTPAAAPVTAPSPAPVTSAGQNYASPGNRPVPSAPVASAPTITLEQVSKAGADLITADSSRLPALNGLLQRYGIASVQELPAEQIGAFATELRGMGAKI